MSRGLATNQIMACLKSFSSPFLSTLIAAMVRSRRVVQLVAVVAIAAIVVVGAILLSGGNDEQEAAAPSPGSTPEADQTYAGIPQNGMNLGKAGAPTLVEIADLQCPFCAQYATTAMPTRRARLRPHRQGPLRAALPQLPRTRQRACGRRRRVRRQAEPDVPVRRRLLPQPGTRGVGLRGSGVHPQDRRAGARPRSRQDGRGRGRSARAAGGAGERGVRACDRLDQHARLLRPQGAAADPAEVQGTAPEDYARALDQALQ